MPPDREHRRQKKRRYTIVFLPESEAGKQRRLTMGKPGFLLLGIGLLLVAVFFVIGALIYTPLGVYLPIPNPELENRYHKQIIAIQDRLTKLTEDLAFLREYNVRLRKALGETLSTEDSAFIASLPQRRRAEPRASLETVEDGTRSGTQPTAALNVSQASFPLYRTVRAVEVELPLSLPVQGYTTQEFNPDQHHWGIDFAGKVGSTIYAASNGSVIFAGWTYEDGYLIMVAHGGGYRTTYKHNQSLLKAAGDYVRRGEPIALLGNTGRTSYGPHLHFEVWKDGIALNPRDLLIALP